MIARTEKVKCPRCSKISSLGAWDKNTYNMCVTEEMKQDYVPLISEEAWTREADTYYKCPECQRYSMGCELYIDSNKPKLAKLGRQPIVPMMLIRDGSVLHKITPTSHIIAEIKEVQDKH